MRQSPRKFRKPNMAKLRHLPWLLVPAAVLLRLAVVGGSFTVDDYAQLTMMRGQYPVPRGALELFTFSDGSPQEVEALTEAGFFPWWRHPELKLAMFRPLSSALMQLDLALFGDRALYYHLHSMLWWIGALIAAGLLLRRLLPGGAWILAFAFFCADEAHATALGWIANRNELVSSALALTAFYLHLRHREDGLAAGRWLVPLLFALSLLAGEYALCYLGYFVAFELWAERPWSERLRGLWPVGLMSGAYLATRQLLGYGSRGSSMYLDPSARPLDFALGSLERFPVQVGDLLLGLQADGYSYGSPWAHALGLDLQGWQRLQLSAGVAATAMWVALLGLALRGDNASRAAQSLGLGAVLSMIPSLAATPSSRTLVPPLLGVTALLALCALWLWRRRGVSRLAVLAIVVLHLGLAIWSTRILTAGAALVSRQVQRSILRAPLDPATVAQQDVFLLGVADLTTTIYLPLVRRFHGLAAPRSCHLMTASWGAHELRRVAADSLELRRLNAVATPGDLYARVFNDGEPLPGLHGRAGPMWAEVVQVDAGVPTAMRFRFARPLDDPSFLFLLQTAAGLQRFSMPAVGRALILPPPLPPLAIPL
ncbi:MAG: hypothetical protein OEZ06_25960 [Myxococcales bacterium]|nr:hypothetical protein [Myxococcales bacterium]